MAVDPRRLAAIQIQLDSLAHETREHADPDLHRALDNAKKALDEAHTVLAERGLYLQIPDGYEPPSGLGGCGGKRGQ